MKVEIEKNEMTIRVPMSDDEGWTPQTRQLLFWWTRQAVADFLATFPKTLEYGGDSGSADLSVMGDAMSTLLGWGEADPVAQELACWFYCLGKISRLISDYQQGKPGKADTWFDITVYSMMARRIQETGGWP